MTNHLPTQLGILHQRDQATATQFVQHGSLSLNVETLGSLVRWVNECLMKDMTELSGVDTVRRPELDLWSQDWRLIGGL